MSILSPCYDQKPEPTSPSSRPNLANGVRDRYSSLTGTGSLLKKHSTHPFISSAGPRLAALTYSPSDTMLELQRSSLLRLHRTPCLQFKELDGSNVYMFRQRTAGGHISVSRRNKDSRPVTYRQSYSLT